MRRPSFPASCSGCHFICTLAALGFDEEDLDSMGGAFPETGNMEDEGYM